MTDRVELPNGHYAVLWDAKEISERDRRVLRHAMPAASRLNKRLEEIQGSADVKAEADALAAGKPWPPELVLDEEGNEVPWQAALTDDDFMAHLTSAEMDALWDLRAARIVAFVKEWDVPDKFGTVIPLPLTIDSVIDIPGEYFDSLVAQAFEKPVGLDSSPEASLDPESPTQPSSDSNADSAEPTGASESSTQSLPTSTGSIGTVDSTP